MIEKRCPDCRYTKGIGYDFWCGEGHTEYEVFGAETNCPYFEYHDWSKGIPSKTEKRFKLDSEVGFIDSKRCGGDTMTHFEVVVKLNKLYEENEQLKSELKALRKKYNDFSDMMDKRLKEIDRGLIE